ncbi:Uma2 family endonuclease [Armatimonas rosea]|uniref:Uma2 family endonuclease n=1 Tax=Armatimonas rosea TaxID=685828 RepID=A0A7W9W5W3_ARMRO|nr:Uma2 family endonuclease [Armatimonas rosea]MBB6049486.1 Uma2 family endonuclease [Armatimonas rosea]
MYAFKLEPQVSAEEYLERERTAEHRSERIDGVIVAMAGASVEHVDIVSNLLGALQPLLRARGCRAMANEMRVEVLGGHYLYPDLVITCATRTYADNTLDILTNPEIVIAVLSPSTEALDRGRKFLLYRQITSVQEYILVSQDRALVESYKREANGLWTYRSIEGLHDTLRLEFLGAEVPLAEVYDGVFSDESRDPA